MNFRFSSKGDPMNYVSRLAANMQTYPPEHTVAGPSLRYDYDPALVRELLGHLVPGNMLLVVVTWDFKGKTDKVCSDMFCACFFLGVLCRDNSST